MRCAACGTDSLPGLRFCGSCGQPLATPAGSPSASSGSAAAPAGGGQAAAPQPSFGEQVVSFLRSVQQEKTGAAAAGLVFVVAAIVSIVGWTPLGWPPGFIRALVPQTNCVGVPIQSAQMYLCSVKVAMLVLAGPLVVMVVMFLLRKQITAQVGRLAPRLPQEARFLVAPVLATAFFVMGWSGAHQQTAFQSGILPQNVFPAVIGLFTFAVVRFGPKVQGALVAYFDVRDRFPVWMRLGVAILVPMLISVIITNQDRVSQEAFKEQFVVLVGLATGYLAMAPRSGDLLTGMRQAMTQLRRPG